MDNDVGYKEGMSIVEDMQDQSFTVPSGLAPIMNSDTRVALPGTFTGHTTLDILNNKPKSKTRLPSIEEANRTTLPSNQIIARLSDTYIPSITGNPTAYATPNITGSFPTGTPKINILGASKDKISELTPKDSDASCMVGESFGESFSQSGQSSDEFSDSISGDLGAEMKWSDNYVHA